MGVTGSSHTTTFHGRFVTTMVSVMTSVSDVVAPDDSSLDISPVFQTPGQNESDRP
jgi:hypothetical protein